MQSDFLYRYQILLSGRSAYAWGNEVGVGRGVAQRMSQGVIPSGETLAAICLAENASISWLLEGKGEPYLVSRWDNDEELAEYLSEVAMESGWTWYVLEHEGQYCIAATQPGQFEIKGRTVDYTILELVCGPVGKASLAELTRHSLNRVNVTEEVMYKLRHGQVGTYQLLHQAGGILRDAEPISIDRLATIKTAEPCPPQYDERNGEGELLSTFRDLTPGHRSVALTTVKALREIED